MNESSQSPKSLYKNGEQVPTSGTYQCIACGNRAYFIKGDIFRDCEVCFAGTDDGPSGFDNTDKEFWKLIDAQ